MQLTTPKRNGRPPKRATTTESTMVTIRLTAQTKNLLIDMADAYGISLAEYITLLVSRDSTQ